MSAPAQATPSHRGAAPSRFGRPAAGAVFDEARGQHAPRGETVRGNSSCYAPALTEVATASQGEQEVNPQPAPRRPAPDEAREGAADQPGGSLRQCAAQ